MLRQILCATAVALAPVLLLAQAMPNPGFRSVGRGWPVTSALPSTGRNPAAL